MCNMKVTVVGKIIEGAMSGDLVKVKSYTELIIKDLENQGEDRACRIIKRALDHNSINKGDTVCLNNR